MRDLTQEEARSCGPIAMNSEVDQHDLLFNRPTTKESPADRDKLILKLAGMLMMSYIISIPASKVDIRGSAVLTDWPGIIFTGEDCTEVYKDMLGSVWIAKLEKGDPGSKANRRVIFKRRIHFRSSLWITSSH
ncbi:hypothetical protein PHMEG_00014224 [Phytophthora megakarya]|uniref:Uncharacterized protein n=1 Tax=Phytophthora megakarya TaxID=4795 RepID=A0A225W5D3_9STRA|nr:hypothetical protein PHMEG_00014224 [Phytophthora megakarya]